MIKKRKGFKKMRADEFEKIKGLLKYGLPQTKVCEITGRGNGTVAVIYKSANFAEYEAAIRAIGVKYAKKPVVAEKAEAEQNPALRNLPQAKQTDSFQSQIVRELKEVNINLIRLAEAWEAKPKMNLFGFGRKEEAIKPKAVNGQ